MTQTLFVRVKNADGKKVERKVQVIRSWQDSDGRHIFLHHNGIYGYKDGQPITNVRELDVIGDKIQHRLALAWWTARGEKIAADHYAALDNARLAMNLRGLPDDAAATSDLDAILYIRRPIKNRSRAAFCEPTSWYEWFDGQRPDWWGHAAVVEMAGFRYEQCDPAGPARDGDGDADDLPPADAGDDDLPPADAGDGLDFGTAPDIGAD